jgi:ribose transport system substrate-binding protein
MIAVRSLRKEAVVPEIMLKPSVVTKTNFQSYETPIESRACPSWDEAAKLAAK